MFGNVYEFNRGKNIEIIKNVFSDCNIIQNGEKLKVIIIGHVMSDGKGDWLAMTNLHREIQQAFPKASIRLISTSDEIHRNKLDTQGLKKIHVSFGEDAGLIYSDPDLLKKIKNCSFIISGPIGNGRYLSKLDVDFSKKSLSFNEYDSHTNFDKFSNIEVTTGLGKDSIGIFTGLNEDYTWKDIENIQLKKILFDSEDITQEYISKYQSLNEFFLCYYTDNSNTLDFIIEAAAFSLLSEKKPDICFPSKTSLEQIKKYFRDDGSRFSRLGNIYIDDLVKYGIGSLKFIEMENGELKEENISLGLGKELRIINPGHLTIRDFKALTKISAPIVGCTGDNSAAQALSFGKIPLHESTGHKGRFGGAIKSLVIKYIGQNSALHDYLTCPHNFNKSLLERNIIQEAQDFGALIRENHSLSESIKAIINENLCRQRYPGFADLSDKLYDDFSENKIDRATLERSLTEDLISRGILESA